MPGPLCRPIRVLLQRHLLLGLLLVSSSSGSASMCLRHVFYALHTQDVGLSNLWLFKVRGGGISYTGLPTSTILAY
jgi:hypothetical protein